VDDPGERLVQALDLLAQVGDAITARQAARDLDDATLQVFWREWPQASQWAGELWRVLDADLARAARPVEDPELDEIGGSG
jgi:hypothetical protein